MRIWQPRVGEACVGIRADKILLDAAEVLRAMNYNQDELRKWLFEVLLVLPKSRINIEDFK